ncbi:hypothetical protein H0H87_005637 [Tephrocybe sp. NHM501043]|nr:hypothetical protein H0H87_005637 [Tephrocybe sp. NHM501043]
MRILQGRLPVNRSRRLSDQTQQWARSNPPLQQTGLANPGWPGCCRPPTPAEHKLIQPMDWRSVSAVHQVSIPPDIKAALARLESLGPPRGSPTPGSAGRAGTKGVIPANDCKSNASPSRSASLSRSSAPTKRRTGSPKQTHSPIGSNLSRSSSSVTVSSSIPTASTVDRLQTQRRERRIEGPHSSNSSPKDKNVDLDAVSPRRSRSAHKGPSVTPSSTSVSLSKVSIEGRSPPSQIVPRPSRRSSISDAKDLTPPKTSPSTTRPAERPSSFVVPRSTKKGEISSASSSSGSDGTGSMTDSTVTSDGGFTDYLSDESEAELQRQAEARAALLAQSQAEELEFKAARLQLAHIDLRPPKTWNPTNITNNTTPRRVV